MAVHLNILLDEELYRRLKAKAPAKRMSAFIAEAVEAKLGPTKRELDDAYKAAAKETWRSSIADEWQPTEIESWPD